MVDEVFRASVVGVAGKFCSTSTTWGIVAVASCTRAAESKGRKPGLHTLPEDDFTPENGSTVDHGGVHFGSLLYTAQAPCPELAMLAGVLAMVAAVFVVRGVLGHAVAGEG